MQRWISVLMFFFVGCAGLDQLSGTQPQTAAMPPEIQAEADRMKKQADAIDDVSVSIRDNGSYRREVGFRANGASMQANLVKGLIAHKPPGWLPDSRRAIDEAEARLTDAVSSGPGLTPDTCVGNIAIAIPKTCAEVQADAAKAAEAASLADKAKAEQAQKDADAAKQAADTQAALQDKHEAEARTLRDLVPQCAAKSADCQTQCDGGQGIYCVALGVRLRDAKPPKINEAKALFTRACGLSVDSGCDLAKQVASIAGDEDQEWNTLAQYTDELAISKFELEKLNKYMTGSRSYARDVQDNAALQRAQVDEHVCPMKKSFITKWGATEYSKRSSLHCKNEPPPGMAYSGGSVPLLAQCMSAFATSCP